MIQGINNQAALYNPVYNKPQPNRVNAEEVNRQADTKNVVLANDKPEKAPEASDGMDLRLDSIKPRQNVKLENLSLSLNQNSSGFEMKGRNSDIELLDMDKAVSDMQKDKVLMQYQYFVGDSDPFLSNEDGRVIPK